MHLVTFYEGDKLPFLLRCLGIHLEMNKVSESTNFMDSNFSPAAQLTIWPRCYFRGRARRAKRNSDVFIAFCAFLGVRHDKQECLFLSPELLGTLFDPCRLAYLAYTSND